MQLKKLTDSDTLEFFMVDNSVSMELPFFASKISAGFPSPADDYVELKLDLNQHLIKHPAATFYVRVKGNSMIDANIHEGDILIVDRALEAKNNDIIIGVLNGEFTVKRLKKTKSGIVLNPENTEFKPIKISSDADFQIWGVISYIIHKA
ncbi:MAG: translesion error-prone DNA polymerase V autoproteolytic subunit [Bacteroidota bacterium]